MMTDRTAGILATLILIALGAASFAATVYALPRAIETLTAEEKL